MVCQLESIISEGRRADCKEASSLIDGIVADALLAESGYDANAIVNQQGMEVVIPPKKNRKEQREYDKELYKIRHLVENAFLHLKRWQVIDTRYAKNSASFLTALQIRCIDLWAKLILRHYLVDTTQTPV